ncbi:hypothetical protein QP089_07105 [Actinomadura sp. OS1-43]|nr:hypothetical protein [Actinomadura sp. OS1-43]MDL4814028.1 hypothetical protein [Actinomadura sp. OS1-43]
MPQTLTVLAVIVGIAWLVGGVVEFVVALSDRARTGRDWDSPWRSSPYSPGSTVEGVHVLPAAEDAGDAIADIPSGTAAALLLIENHWAVALRDAIMRANGFRISDAFVSPFDLVEIGLHTAQEARRLQDMETSETATGR